MPLSLNHLKRLFQNNHYSPLNRVYLSRASLLANYEYLSSVHQNVKIAPVLKSNAYGHGITQIGPLIAQANPPLICVDSLFEAYQLKKAGLKTPILIMGFVDPSSLRTAKLPFSFTVFGPDMATALSHHQPGAKIHLFVDTGMHREGILIAELSDFLIQIRHLNLQLEGVMSHFASADVANGQQTKQQQANFNTAIKIVHQAGFNPKWIHLSASAGLFSASNHHCNLARVGKALYGIDPLGKTDSPLRPVMKLTTKIAQIKHLQKGDQVGYGATYTAAHDLLIGILPIGYNDGVDRRLSNQGLVKIGDKFSPIIGRISMNVTTIDLTNIPEPYLTEEVVVFSDNPADKNSILHSAEIAGTIPHELLVRINPTSIRRDIV